MSLPAWLLTKRRRAVGAGGNKEVVHAEAVDVASLPLVVERVVEEDAVVGVGASQRDAR
jgi:hypothetical protein